MAQGFTRGVPIDTDPNLSLDSDLVVPSQKAVKDYIDTGLADKVDRAGDTMAGNLILNANPTLPLQAATKDYVDTLINGIDWKQAADAGTVSALPAYTVTGSGQILTGNVNGAIPSATTDGVTLTANQRLLVKSETSTLAPNNGIYVVTQVGGVSQPFVLTRSVDANTPALLAEATLAVKAGSTLANTQWHCNPAAVPIVIGTTDITFAQIGSGGNSIQSLTGDVTATSSSPSQLSVTATIANNAVTYAKMQAVGATSRLLGSSSTTTPVQEITLGTNLSMSGTTLNASGGGTITALTGDVSASGSGSVTATLANNLKTGSCGVTFDGGGQVVQTKIAYVQMPYNGTLGTWYMVADQVGACTIAVSKGLFGSFPTSSAVYSVNPAIPATNITATNAGAYNPGMATVTAGDVLKFEISAITAITWVNLSILITKT